MMEITDFPSDPLGATRNLRIELLHNINKARLYSGHRTILKNILEFATAAVLDMEPVQEPPAITPAKVPAKRKKKVKETKE